MKNYLVHGTLTNQCVTVRIIVVVAEIKGFRLWVVADKLAYFQSDKPLIRNILVHELRS